MNTSMYSWKKLVISLWSVGSPFLTPNGIRTHTKAPNNKGGFMLVLQCNWYLMIS
jgi:hypothetical protein